MGTPQGAIVSTCSCITARLVVPQAPDIEAIIVRYADIVVGFQHKRDAERYLRERERLARFGLSLHQDKTRLVEFGARI